MKTKDWIVNALVAAIYVAVTFAGAGFAFGAVQFRVSEVLNHLAVFDKKYIIGIVAGVVLSNLFFSPMAAYDIVFGVAHSLISLLAMRFLTRNTENETKKMWGNVLMFAFFSFFVAIELYLLGLPFWFSWFTVALGEVVVMALGIPLMKWLNERVDFKKQLA